MTKQVIMLDDYKKDKQPFEVMPADNVASEYLLIQRKEVEKVVPNNIKHAKNTFDEVVSLFTMALHSPKTVQSEDISNIIIPYATQDIDKDQREKSNASLVVASNVDDKVVLSSVDGNVKNEQDENGNKYRRIDLSSQENMDVLSGNNVTLTNVSDSSDEESTPEKSKRLTFTDSDLPDDDEIRDIIQMYYPKPTVVDRFSESELENSSEDETYESLRCRNKIEPITKIDLTRMIGIEKLPGRILTRLRKPTFKLLSGGEVSKNKSTILKPSYLTEQEGQMDEDIILENIKRVKSFQKAKTYKASKNHEILKEVKKEITLRKRTRKSNELKRKVKVKNEKNEIKGKETKTFARKNTKEDGLELNSISAAKITTRIRSVRMENDGKIIHNKTKIFARKNTIEDGLELNSISAAKTTTRRTRSMRIENGGKNIQNKCQEMPISGTKNKKPDHKRTPKKARIIFPEIEVRRSKTLQEVKQKNDDTMNAPLSILKKSIPKQSTVHTSSSCESQKSLKRSLIDNSDVPSPKQTRSHNINNYNSINNASLRATPARLVKTQYVHLSTFPGKVHKQDKIDPYVHLVRHEPAQYSDRNFLCKRTRKSARTPTKRL